MENSKLRTDGNTMSFDSIWSSLTSVEMELDDAFLRMATAYSHIVTTKDAYVKLCEG